LAHFSLLLLHRAIRPAGYHHPLRRRVHHRGEGTGLKLFKTNAYLLAFKHKNITAMKKKLISMVLLGAIVASISTGCGSLPKRGQAPPRPPGAPAPPR